MTSTVRITLQGLPERVHEIADVLDEVVPGTFEWHDAIGGMEHYEILLHGVGVWDTSMRSLDTN